MGVIKKESNWLVKYLLFGVGVLILFCLFWYRQVLIEKFWLINNIWKTDVEIKISLNEKEELEKLRVENLTLKNNLDDLKDEINLMEDGLEPTYIKMLGDNLLTNLAAGYYGSFYTTYPKDKTVYKGMNVYTHGNVLVGTVEEVFKTNLFVTRLGQNKTFLAESAEVDEEMELSSVGNGLYVGQIAAGSKVSVGDQVVLKGYPKAIVGMVGEIIKNEGTLSTVYIRAPYNIYTKEIFYVLQ